MATRFDNDHPNVERNFRYFNSSIAINAVQICIITALERRFKEPGDAKVLSHLTHATPVKKTVVIFTLVQARQIPYF